MLPIIDLGLFLNGSPTERKQVASDLIAACRKYGFAYIKNYTLPESSLSEAYSWSHKFFNMSDSQKLSAPHPPGFTHHRGYLSIGKEKVKDHETGYVEPSDPSLIPDIKETFDTGHPDNPAQPNIWPPPQVIPGFQSSMETFFNECFEATQAIIKCLSVGMDLPEDFFTSKCSSNQNQLRFARYPSIPTADFKNNTKTRFGAHADWSFFTILFQDECGGLEVEDPERPGEYIAVKPIPGTLVMNVGDVLKRWSNDELRSSMHRVGPPPEVKGEMYSRERYSIPYFTALDADVVIETLPMFVTEKNPKKYKPISVQNYLMAKAQGIEV